jgi:hypothetical protein
VFVAGVAAAWALVIGVYALCGRGALFVRTIGYFVALFASGSLGGVPLPISEETFTSWSALTKPWIRGGFMLEYALPGAVYALTGASLIATLFSRRWTARSTLLLGVLAFGVGTFRVALGRSDYDHLIVVTAPAVLLLAALATDAVDGLSGLKLSARPPLSAGAALIVLLVVLSCKLTGTEKGFGPRTVALLRGDDAPSTGPPYRYPDIPRAGDIFLPPDTVALTQAIRQRTKPDDKVFVHAAFIEGAELYFLADRVNPTRCDLMAEVLTTSVQEEVGRSLRADPPVLDVGDDYGMLGPATTDYLKAGWETVEKVGSVSVRTRRQ